MKKKKKAVKWPLAGPNVAAIARWVSSDKGKSDDFTHQSAFFPEVISKKLLVHGEEKKKFCSWRKLREIRKKWPAVVSPDNRRPCVRKEFKSIKELQWRGMKKVAV